MFDENLYQETISALHASEDTLSEVMNMTHKTKRRGRLRTTGGACGGHRDPVLHGGSCSGAWTGSAVGGVLWSNGGAGRAALDSGGPNEHCEAGPAAR